jgi:hypothetical protein
MSKPRFVISCPFDTYSGYGARARDFVKAVIELDKYEVELLSQKWGETSWGFCKDHPEWQFLFKYSAKKDWQATQPDLWMQITIPNEFQPIGKYNIGLTAGIESTGCKPEWVEGLNRMDLNLVSSNFAKNTFEKMAYEKKDQRTNQLISVLKLEKPVEVLFEGINLDLYKPITPKEIKTIDLDSIKEQFCFLSVGHWMQGELGHDRKNIGITIKSFYETFKNKRDKPALILKCSLGVASYISRDEILDRIKSIKSQFSSANLPNIYLLNGEFNDKEINELYNHPKVKAMVSLTKGEGFGRPLLEFSTTGKPIIAPNWSGHTDFLNPEYVSLLPGVLENVHHSAANNWLIPESQWFKVDERAAMSQMRDVYKKYKKFLQLGKKQKYYSKENFSYNHMKQLLNGILTKNVPEIAQQVKLNLSQLTKID